MTSTVLLCLLAVWLVIASLARFVLRKRAHRNAGAPVSSEGNGPLIADGLGLLGGWCASLGILLGGGLFLDERSRPAAEFLAVAGFLSTTLDFASSRQWSRSKTESPTRRYLLTTLTFLTGLAILGYVLYLRSQPGPDEEAVQLDMPVHGTGIVVSGGRDALTNYHHNQPPQQNGAVDLVFDGRPHASEGQFVYAPVSGVVREAVGTRGHGEEPAEGNLIILRTAAGHDIWLAHLQKGSVRVHKDEVVRKGQLIAAVGSSGSAAEPHLHIHAQRDELAVPIVFGSKRRYLVRGDRVVASPVIEQ